MLFFMHYNYKDGDYIMINLNQIEHKASQVSALLKSLSNEKRLLIICALYRGEKSVGELEEIVDISQSALSQHLARLRRDRMVSTRREAQTIFYSLKDDQITERVLDCLGDVCNLEQDHKHKLAVIN